MPHIQLPEGLPGIVGRLAFRPETAKPLNELAEILLRGPSTLSRGERSSSPTTFRRKTIVFFDTESMARSRPIISVAMMEPMFLPEVEGNPQPSPVADLIRNAQAGGHEYPKIWHLFAYQPQATGHLSGFTQEIMRGECPLSPGIRELIAAFTSYGNDCPF